MGAESEGAEYNLPPPWIEQVVIPPLLHMDGMGFRRGWKVGVAEQAICPSQLSRLTLLTPYTGQVQLPSLWAPAFLVIQGRSRPRRYRAVAFRKTIDAVAPRPSRDVYPHQ